MVQYDRMVLNHLLDTYENSLLSIGENRRKTGKLVGPEGNVPRKCLNLM